MNGRRHNADHLRGEEEEEEEEEGGGVSLGRVQHIHFHFPKDRFGDIKRRRGADNVSVDLLNLPAEKRSQSRRQDAI
ncbi:uncharacterized protein V6R79_011535 [Siganus canaliculatus]